MGWRRGSPFLYAVNWLQGRFAPYVSERRNILSYLETGRPAEMRWLHSVDLERGALVGSGSIRSKTPEQRLSFAKERTQAHFGAEEPISPYPEHYFREILELCSAHPVEAIVVQLPMTDEYLEAAAEFIDARTFDQRVRALIAPYPNVHLAETREVFSGQPHLFVDSDHLNERGAVRFSRKLRNEYIRALR